MPRHRLGFQHLTQVHLERIDSRHWRLIISDGIHFFQAKNVRSYVITDKTLKKLKQQIEKELEE